MSGQGRRPITEVEHRHTVALGTQLRELREAARMTRRRLAKRVALSEGHIGVLERGERRTRPSTLERLVVVLVHRDAVESELDRLVELAGPALAPESEFFERVRKRRERRERREIPAFLRDARAVVATLQGAVRDLPEGPRADRRRALLEEIQNDVRAMETRLVELGAPLPDPELSPREALAAFEREHVHGRRMSKLSNARLLEWFELQEAARAEGSPS